MTLAKSSSHWASQASQRELIPRYTGWSTPTKAFPAADEKMLNSRFGQICGGQYFGGFFATLVILAVILRRQVLGCIRQDSQTKECHLAKLGSPTHFQKQVGRGACLHLATLTLVVTLPTTVCPLIFANSPTQN